MIWKIAFVVMCHWKIALFLFCEFLIEKLYQKNLAIKTHVTDMLRCMELSITK